MFQLLIKSSGQVIVLKFHVYSLMQYDISQNHAPLRTFFETNTYAVTQFDTCLDAHSIWPEIDALSFLLKAYPNAFYLHTIRDPLAHVESILNWRDLAHRLNTTGLLSRFGGQSSDQSIAKNIEIFIHNAREIVRGQIRKYPNYKYLEIDLTKPSSALKLAQFIHLNVPSNFVLPHSNQGTKKPSPSETQQQHQAKKDSF
jgi:hypothetical protein